MKCKICGNTKKNSVLNVKEMFVGTRDVFEYLLCNKCNSLTISSIPDNLSLYYSKYYSFSEENKKRSLLKRLLKRLLVSTSSSKLSLFISPFLKQQNDLRIKALSPYAFSKSSKILDVGCGSGSFLLDLNQLGYFNLYGIDPFLENDLKINDSIFLKKKPISEVTDTFDLVTFHHSFEHVEDPLETLIHLKSLLTDSGIAILRFPNIESYSFRRFQQHWEGIHAPFHVVLPSQPGMKEMLQKANLRILEIRYEQLLSLFLNSVAHELDVCDYEQLGSRKYLEKNKRGTPPLLTKTEVKIWKERVKQTLKYGTTDWIVYYLKKS